MIVYIETNFLMGAATGRDAKADELLQIPATQLQIAMPAACIMEAWSAFEDERTRRKSFRDTLTQQLSQLERDATSDHARTLQTLLEQAILANGNLLNDIDTRLRQIVQSVIGTDSSTSRVQLLPLALSPSLFMAEIMDDPTDDIILATIIDHAQRHPAEEQVVLTGNSKHFDTAEVRAALRNVGIDHYFSRTEAFLGWFRAQPRP